tara:strand:+ start:14344 stop:14568 length:225 start_codon:yes stop_codon:yes gene_type:complete
MDYDDKFRTISSEAEGAILCLTWHPATKQMGVEDFKNTLSLLADEVVRQQLKSVVVDVRQFYSGVASEIDDWRL